MPAHLCDDGVHAKNNPQTTGNMFSDYAAVADNIGVYTPHDYADIVDHLVRALEVEMCAWVRYCAGAGGGLGLGGLF